MNTTSNPAGGGAREQLTFSTLNGNSGMNNPWSREMILAMKRMSQRAYVLKSEEEVLLMEPVAGMVALFDKTCFSMEEEEGLSERPPYIVLQKEDPRVPEWARQLATESCVAICREAMLRQTIIENVARELIRDFTLDHDGDYHSHRQEKERYRRSIPAQRAQRQIRPEGHFKPISGHRRKVGQY